MAAVARASYLPTIKCSDCGTEVEFMAMAHHACNGQYNGSQSPSPTEKTMASLLPREDSIFNTNRKNMLKRMDTITQGPFSKKSANKGGKLSILKQSHQQLKTSGSDSSGKTNVQDEVVAVIRPSESAKPSNQILKISKKSPITSQFPDKKESEKSIEDGENTRFSNISETSNYSTRESNFEGNGLTPREASKPTMRTVYADQRSKTLPTRPEPRTLHTEMPPKPPLKLSRTQDDLRSVPMPRKDHHGNVLIDRRQPHPQLNRPGDLQKPVPAIPRAGDLNRPRPESPAYDKNPSRHVVYQNRMYRENEMRSRPAHSYDELQSHNRKRSDEKQSTLQPARTLHHYKSESSLRQLQQNRVNNSNNFDDILDEITMSLNQNHTLNNTSYSRETPVNVNKKSSSNESINSGYSESNTKSNRDRTSQPKKEKSICRVCNLVIEGEKPVFSSDGKLSGKFHKKCFKCAQCMVHFYPSSASGVVVKGEQPSTFYVFENKPYCPHDYHVKNNSLCPGCKTGIEGQCRVVDPESQNPQRFHVECFCCAIMGCSSDFEHGYYEIGSQRFCVRHAPSTKSTRRYTRMIPFI